MEKDYLLHKWLNNEATSEELELLKTDPEYVSYIQIAIASTGFEAPQMDTESNLKAISNKIKPPRTLEKPHTFSTFWKVAAILVLVIAGYYYTTMSDKSIKTEIAQTETFLLPDDSEVVLNADSKITYNKKNWDGSRELSLDGEAYFKVTKGNKFSVKTVEGTVSVLGTQFNVFARNGFFIVACYEGLVSVSFNNEEIKVPAGSKIQIENGKLVINQANENPSPVWLSNESNFESAPLSLVLKELERQFPIKVTVGKVVPDHRFSGTFTHTDLELALKAICGPLHLNYTINKNGTVFINAKNSE